MKDFYHFCCFIKESTSNKCFKNSAYLRVSSVFLCVTVTRSYAENRRDEIV